MSPQIQVFKFHKAFGKHQQLVHKLFFNQSCFFLLFFPLKMFLTMKSNRHCLTPLFSVICYSFFYKHTESKHVKKPKYYYVAKRKYIDKTTWCTFKLLKETKIKEGRRLYFTSIFFPLIMNNVRDKDNIIFHCFNHIFYLWNVKVKHVWSFWFSSNC
jgi:hypothetical protein